MFAHDLLSLLLSKRLLFVFDFDLFYPFAITIHRIPIDECRAVLSIEATRGDLLCDVCL